MPISMPDDRWVRWMLVPAVVFIALATNDAHLVDFWHHLARGRYLVETHQLLDHDIFTYTVNGAQFQDVNWLTQVIYYQLFTLGGLGLTRTINALVLALAWLWLIDIARREGGSLEVAMTLGIATFLGSWQVLTIRPQTFSILLFVALLDWLLRAERDSRWLVATPLAMLAWPNLHGAFPAGLMLLGIFWFNQAVVAIRGKVDERGRSQVFRWTLALVFSSLATLVNPYGWGIYRYVGGTSSIAARRGIDEWLPPSWNQGIGAAFFLSLPLLAGVVIFAWRRGRKLTLREVLLLACFGVLAIRSIRMVIWWLLILTPILAPRVALLINRHAPKYVPNLGATVTVGVLLLLCILSVPPLHAYNPLLMLRAPTTTTHDLESTRRDLLRPHGQTNNLFTRLEWAEYFVWASSPDWRVFMDGRIEIIPDSVWEEYSTITRGKEGWQRLLDQYDVAALVLDRDFHSRTGLLQKVQDSEHWVNLGERGNAVTFGRVR